MSDGAGTLPADVVARVRDCIAARAGLEPVGWVLERRLDDRMRALDVANPADYAHLLESPAGLRELELLIEALRVGETRFFRHRSHVAALTDLVAPAIRKARGSGTVSAWSAGCATGQEPYTLAMVLGRLLPRHQVSVLATDISAEAVDAARRAVYPAAVLANVPDDWQRYGFTTAGTDDAGRPLVRVADTVARRVRFERRNLHDGGFPRGLDLIWCRNVLIYFEREARARAIDRLAASLAPGGFLFLGYAETLRDLTDLETIRTPDATLYRRQTTAPARPHRASAPPPPARRPSAPPPLTREEIVIELRGRYGGDDPQRLARELAPLLEATATTAVIDVNGADYLGDEAAATLRRALSAARAAGVSVQLAARRPGTRRWLQRWGLTTEASS